MDNNNDKLEYKFWAEEINHNNLNDEDNILDAILTKEPKSILFQMFLIIIFLSAFCLYGYKLYKNELKASYNKHINKDYNINQTLNIDTPSRQEARIEHVELSNIKQGKDELVNKMINDALPSIVSVVANVNDNDDDISNWFGPDIKDMPSQYGTGIIINQDENELLIVTNNHVIGNANEIQVSFINKSKANASLKGVDLGADLAILAVPLKDIDSKTLKEIKHASVGNSSDAKVGEMVVAIGNALGYGQSVTVGYISAKDRKVEIESSILGRKKMLLLQTDAAINPGNSGGALLDLNGNVIGINTVKFASKRIEGMGYAIPINRAMPIINEIILREELQEHERGFLGILGGDVLDDDEINYGMPIGVYISELIEGAAAEEAGLLVGDIIVGINDIEIVTIDQLKDKVSSIRVGTSIKITYKRMIDGKYSEQEVMVKLGENTQD